MLKFSNCFQLGQSTLLLRPSEMQLGSLATDTSLLSQRKASVSFAAEHRSHPVLQRRQSRKHRSLLQNRGKESTPDVVDPLLLSSRPLTGKKRRTKGFRSLFATECTPAGACHPKSNSEKRKAGAVTRAINEHQIKAIALVLNTGTKFTHPL